eukprot:TRINITY_DN12880_c0_g1_i1.p1 TRINITY_DN12880_c0_g1~~TRINITY_DN12880_c0_g1_i1.p1  ORF type:complete len:1275 (-),score=285.90 TRINITY_DN12880_c0_g1_i1:36-3860(-)
MRRFSSRSPDRRRHGYEGNGHDDGRRRSRSRGRRGNSRDRDRRHASSAGGTSSRSSPGRRRDHPSSGGGSAGGSSGLDSAVDRRLWQLESRGLLPRGSLDERTMDVLRRTPPDAALEALTIWETRGGERRNPSSGIAALLQQTSKGRRTEGLEEHRLGNTGSLARRIQDVEGRYPPGSVDGEAKKKLQDLPVDVALSILRDIEVKASSVKNPSAFIMARARSAVATTHRTAAAATSGRELERVYQDLIRPANLDEKAHTALNEVRLEMAIDILQQLQLQRDVVNPSAWVMRALRFRQSRSGDDDPLPLRGGVALPPRAPPPPPPPPTLPDRGRPDLSQRPEDHLDVADTILRICPNIDGKARDALRELQPEDAMVALRKLEAAGSTVRNQSAFLMHAIAEPHGRPHSGEGEYAEGQDFDTNGFHVDGDHGYADGDHVEDGQVNSAFADDLENPDPDPAGNADSMGDLDHMLDVGDTVPEAEEQPMEDDVEQEGEQPLPMEETMQADEYVQEEPPEEPLEDVQEEQMLMGEGDDGLPPQDVDMEEAQARERIAELSEQMGCDARALDALAVSPAHIAIYVLEDMLPRRDAFRNPSAAVVSALRDRERLDRERGGRPMSPPPAHEALGRQRVAELAECIGCDNRALDALAAANVGLALDVLEDLMPRKDALRNPSAAICSALRDREREGNRGRSPTEGQLLELCDKANLTRIAVEDIRTVPAQVAWDILNALLDQTAQIEDGSMWIVDAVRAFRETGEVPYTAGRWIGGDRRRHDVPPPPPPGSSPTSQDRLASLLERAGDLIDSRARDTLLHDIAADPAADILEEVMHKRDSLRNPSAFVLSRVAIARTTGSTTGKHIRRSRSRGNRSVSPSRAPPPPPPPRPPLPPTSGNSFPGGLPPPPLHPPVAPRKRSVSPPQQPRFEQDNVEGAAPPPWRPRLPSGQADTRLEELTIKLDLDHAARDALRQVSPEDAIDIVHDLMAQGDTVRNPSAWVVRATRGFGSLQQRGKDDPESLAELETLVEEMGIDSRARQALSCVPARSAVSILRDLSTKEGELRNPSAWVSRQISNVRQQIGDLPPLTGDVAPISGGSGDQRPPWKRSISPQRGGVGGGTSGFDRDRGSSDRGASGHPPWKRASSPLPAARGHQQEQEDALSNPSGGASTISSAPPPPGRHGRLRGSDGGGSQKGDEWKELTLSDWVDQVDGGKGFLSKYVQAIVDNYDTVDQIVDLYLQKNDRDQSELDVKFFEEIGAEKSGHRGLFNRWVARTFDACDRP